jgi:hypothetical protein
VGAPLGLPEQSITGTGDCSLSSSAVMDLALQP